MPSGDKIRVTLFGAAGRMGGEAILMIQGEQNMEIAHLLEHPNHPSVGSNLFGIEVKGDPYELALAGTIFCDFTSAKAALKNAALAAELGCPILIGSTGFDSEQLNYLESLSEKIPVMFAPNLSKGVNLLYELVKMTAEKLGIDYDAEIVEIHHKWKKDAPSGTANEIIHLLKNAGYKNVNHHSLRMGDIIGEHCVIFAGEGETLLITHRAQSRKAFAKGVIPAIKYLALAKPGWHSIKDALGI